MIGIIKGKIYHMQVPTICILTKNDIGYDIELPLSAYCRLTLNQEVLLWTYLIVREDAQILCGFIERDDREAFKKLIKISGVGVKMALAMLSAMNAKQLHQCIVTENESLLTSIPGVGKKTAQRLLIELKDKFNEFADNDMPVAVFNDDNPSNLVMALEVESALVNLGYKEKEAKNAIKAVTQSQSSLEYTQMQQLLRATLKYLSGI